MLLTAACLVAAGAAPAADKDGNYAVWGPGGRSCYTFNNADAETGRDPYRHYVMGYLTAYNALAAETYGISGDMNLDAVMTWLGDYCSEKPVHSFEQALIDFTTTHTEARYRQAPSRGSR